MIESEEKLNDSCRLDWWAGSYRAADSDELHEVVRYFADIGKDMAGPKCFRQGAGRRFYANALHAPDAGIQIRWSDHEDRSNPGWISVDLTGTFWGQLEAEERKALFLDSVELPGWSKCTRMDAQRTIVDPMANSDDIWRLVRERKIWLAGYSGFTQLGLQDSKGDAINGASTCWGKPTAAVRCLTYDKAREQNIRSQTVVRHEVRCRSSAAQGYFDALMQTLQNEGESDAAPPTTAERAVVRSILERHMTYKDTTRYSHIEDKAEWPTNWASRTERADFMHEVLEGDFVEVKPARRFQKALQERKAWADHQYGGTYALWVLHELLDTNKELAEVMDDLLDHWMVRLKDEHLDELQAATTIQRQWLEEYVRGWRQHAAQNIEHELE